MNYARQNFLVILSDGHCSGREWKTFLKVQQGGLHEVFRSIIVGYKDK
jgi:hypothetical protein